MSESDPKIGMTKIQVIELLEKLKKNKGDQSFRPVVAALEVAVEMIQRCETCTGSGTEELDYIPHPPFTKKITATGVNRYFIVCRRCKGTKKNLIVVCTSCGLGEHIVWDSKSLDHCQKCIERLKRKGVI